MTLTGAVQDEPASGDMSASSVLDSTKTPMRRQASSQSLKAAAQGQAAFAATGESFLQIGDVQHGDASSFASQTLAGPPARGDTSGSHHSAPSTPAGRGARRIVRSASVGGAFSSWGGAAHPLGSAPSRPQSARCSTSVAASTAAAAAAAAAAASGASVPLCSTVTSPSAMAAQLPGAPPVPLMVPRRKPAYWHSLHALQSYETSQSDILPRSHSAQALCLDQTDSSTASSVSGAGGMRRVSSVQHAFAPQVEFGSVGGGYRPGNRYTPGMPGMRVKSGAYGGLQQPRSVGEMQRFGSTEGSLSGSLEAGMDSGRGKVWGLRGASAAPPLGKHVEGTAAEERGLGLDLAEISAEEVPGAGRTDIAEMVMSASVGGHSSVHSGKVKYLDEITGSGMEEGPHLGWSPGPVLGVLLSSSGRGTESKPLDNPLVDTEEGAPEIGRSAGTTMMIAHEMQMDGGTAAAEGATHMTLLAPANPHRLETV